MCSIKFQMLLKKNISKLKTKVSKIRTCWNSWTLVARVGRWTLDSGRWTRWTLFLPVSEQTQNPISVSS